MIDWRANKQDTVTQRLNYLIALSQTAKGALYVSRLLKEKELLISLDNHHIRIECDNKQTI
jgi:hypothetical protein